MIRLPRQPGGGGSLEKEYRWLPYFSERLPVSVPEFIYLGAPDEFFDEKWAVLRWLPGEHPKSCAPRDLAELILAFRTLEIPEEAAADQSLLQQYRGYPLEDYDSYLRKNIDQCRALEGLDIDLDKALDLWERTLQLPASKTTKSWFHGDLVAENLLVSEGRISSLIDFGGLGIGDPTVDLHGIWELFDAAARNEFRELLGADQVTWQRGKAWALAIALMTFPYYWKTMPDRVQSRLRMANAVLNDSN